MSIREQIEPELRLIGVTEIARRTGISQSTLSEWVRESRFRRMSETQLDALATAVGGTWYLIMEESDVSSK